MDAIVLAGWCALGAVLGAWVVWFYGRGPPMRDKFSEEVEKGRVRHDDFATAPGERMGAFFLTSKPTGTQLKVIISDGSDWAESGLAGPAWEHVSVSTRTRIPLWAEMCWIKSLFFKDDEVVIQYHPARKDYVNIHDYVLHLWRPIGIEIPMPPKGCV